MKTTIGVAALGLLVAACSGGSTGSGAMPAAEIGQMSGNEISIVYYDSVSGMGDATQMAMAYCDPMGAEPVARADATGGSMMGGTLGGMMPGVDQTVVTFRCK